MTVRLEAGPGKQKI